MRKEVEDVLRTAPRAKSPGPNGLPYEFYKKNMKMMVPILVKLFNSCLSEFKTTPDGGKAIVITLLKGGEVNC